MADDQWWLVIDIGQPLSEGSVEHDPGQGLIRIPFATQQSVHVAAGRMRLYIQEPASYVKGEVITSPAEIEGP